MGSYSVGSSTIEKDDANSVAQLTSMVHTVALAQDALLL